MKAGIPSRTALGAATHRAVHQRVEGGRIFRDDLAIRILGEDAERRMEESEQRSTSRRMRLFIAARHRFAEERIKRAIESGVDQIVVLGAGLDTFAYRHAPIDGVRIFEVDHPSTQAWKHESLSRARIEVPTTVTYVPVDFEQASVLEELQRAGFETARAAFFSWLGVVPYLSEEAVEATLRFLASVKAEVVFDYANPPESYSPELRAAHDERAARVASIGESWRTYFDTSQLHTRMEASGFEVLEDYGPPEIAARIFKTPVPTLERNGAHLLRARSRLQERRRVSTRNSV